MVETETQTESRLASTKPTGSNELSKLIEQYGCGPVQFTGTNDALYERHLVFDNVMDAAALGARGVVINNRPLTEPWNLGPGWRGYDFEREATRTEGV